ncbi:hypothetical protein EUX98_g792 [Antrodiella citrinella]|uniref:ribonuclease T2 n=1 Tax=Antrodiella citrinella TaxID=2447956 RepID=A0A4S4N648_9APHY|nr:hypothetical protein EUX98_g792 [Antrodiella citrinella]
MATFSAITTFLAATSVAHATVLGGSLFPVLNSFPNLTACASEPAIYSCENTTAIQNTCCSPTPGGLVLQTQFWSTYTGLESRGQLLPKGSWTIHGLWPDNCDGSFESYCDFTRQFDPAPAPATIGNTTVPVYKGPGVDSFIRAFNRFDLLDYMQKYWINQGDTNAVFWAHEFSKHATCTSTFDVACYGDNYQEHEEVVGFFEAVIRAFKIYPTYDMLAAYGIVPSNTTTYSLAQIQTALKTQTGAIPYLGCTTNGTVLSEVWYMHHVLGSEQFGHFKTLDSVSPTTCSNSSGIHYYERTSASEHEKSEPLVPSLSAAQNTIKIITTFNLYHHSVSSMPPEYHLESFWTTRFQHETRFEWLGDGRATVIPLLREYLHAKKNSTGWLSTSDIPRTLHIGAGTSTLSDHILREYEEVVGGTLQEGTIVNTDFSAHAVLQGRIGAGEGIVRWEEVDMLDWANIVKKLGDNRPEEKGNGRRGFSVIIDKSTSDAISCAPNVSLDLQTLQSTDPCPAIAAVMNHDKRMTVEPVELLALHLAALVPPDGIWIAQSYSSDRFPFLTEPSPTYPDHASVFWSVRQVIPVDAPSGQAKEGVHAPTIQHFVYVLERTQTPCEGR